jgi:hypothetical protein
MVFLSRNFRSFWLMLFVDMVCHVRSSQIVMYAFEGFGNSDPAIGDSFHPQTDGRAEASNEVVARYMKAYSTHSPGQGDIILPLAEFAYDSAVHRTTKMTPFRLDLGWTPDMPVHAIAVVARRGNLSTDSSWKGVAFADHLERRLRVAQDRLRDAQDV